MIELCLIFLKGFGAPSLLPLPLLVRTVPGLMALLGMVLMIVTQLMMTGK
ncbi:hypothetical protein Godav_005860 [Gossypium davidsonii]|uniref:Uncharacterized protein n=2 Tax=Gossypium TaxID=3633 RepID=A0A7J8S220_GOSDV|nr:hypothetical protein [Gossypium davidsonii]MBA0655492.1 hypothetical protein [Gossypium klotzschianum]